MQLHASVILEIFTEEKKTTMTDSWPPRDTTWCFMEALSWRSVNTLKLAEEKAWPRRPEIKMTYLTFMEPPGSQSANYDWPKECVSASHLWPWTASGGPASSIKQGQDGTVYQTETV